MAGWNINSSNTYSVLGSHRNSRLGDPGNMRIYPERGLILVVQRAGYVVVWNIDDDRQV